MRYLRWLMWFVAALIIFSVWFYACDREARAMPIDVWVLVSEHVFVPEDMFNKSECEALRKKVLKVDKKAVCVPVQVDREIS